MPTQKANRTHPASTDLVRNYLHEIGRVPLLTHDEEVIYGKQVQQMNQLLTVKAELEEHNEAPVSLTAWAKAASLEKDNLQHLMKQGQQAKQKMMQANLRLVVSVAKKYLKRNLDFLDLIQEGSLGLDRAVDKFDPTKGYRFSTYSYWWIRQAMTRAIAQQARTIRLPVHIVEQLNKIKKAQRILTQQLGRQATSKELATELEMDLDKIKEYLKLSRPILSLDLRIGDQQDTELIDLLQDDHTVTPDAYVTREALRQNIQTVFSHLTPQEREVLTLRFGLEDGNPQTLSKIGDKLSLSRERIRTLQRNALSYIRRYHSAQCH